ncbi:zinc dependent phospholipase C family protein [Pontibacillus yanchengensis]|uniref:Phospholipase C/D domain-containing protein n=1 Tax=Pontibacillus yanchengensis Y32 TaxID=1385514 RepID=A0A0A2TCT3_9BACI|nr:zinc dependent phospholipase C family protein [Pontibacillus yanchengensis]KGP72238.1 hypothetical protein N782_13340 [Pontibacillus yanchengensis Y32]
MPNIWTHILFCEDLIDSIGATEEWTAVQPYFNLGAQGPDPFFYHNFLPWKKDGSVNEIGNVLHHHYCGPVLLSMIEQAKRSSSLSTKAYVAGFVTHHILDRNTHPFIHYLAGYHKNKHQELEVIIDTIMMERYRNLQTWKTPVYKEINVGRSLDAEIELLLDKSIELYFPKERKNVPSHYIQAAYKDMKRALRVLYDPYGWKNILLGSMISSFSHQPVKTDKDYLNEQQKMWRHSATNESFTEGFLDLYEHARAEGIEVLSELFSYWESPTEGKRYALQTILSNISYDTGKPIDLQLTNQYCDPIV